MLEKTKKENVRKGKKRKSKYSVPSRNSDDELVSIRSSNIGPGVSTTTLVAYSDKNIKSLRKSLRMTRSKS